jgi:type I restriction-modification system DNA methylase subunit
MKTTLYLNWKANPSMGEVFTPIGLVNNILDKIPLEVWKNPESTFLDPCMGKGTFLLEIIRRLVYIYGYTEEDAKSRVYGYDVRVKYVNYLIRRGLKNVRHKDFLNEIIEMKFDVVLGNPPYHKKVGPKKTEPIWIKFVEKSFDICKEDGYVIMIHPSGWRNVDGNFKRIQKLILSNSVKYLEMHNEKDGQKAFNATTSFDWYVVKNKKNENLETEIKGWDNNKTLINLKDFNFIPNGKIKQVLSLVAKDNEEKVSIVHSYSDYETRKPHMSKIRTEEHIHPCVYTTLKDGSINVYFSTTKNNGHFGVSKLIWSNGMASTPFIDFDGGYGLTQFAYAIIDDVDNLPLIKKVLDSDIFLNLIGYCYMSSGDRYNRKILATFRKDFWREFLDEDGNIIEPNLNQSVEQL